MKYAYINGKILDGDKDMQVKEGMVILTDGEKITGIEKEVPSAADIKVIDLGGRYIMPGLINMHVHLAGNGKPRKKQRDNEKLVKTLMGTALSRAVAYKIVSDFAKTELLSGVTTIRTVGGLGDFDTKLRDEVVAGKKTGPRILAANEGISVPGGHMAGSVAVAAGSIDEALKQLEHAENEKADLIKLMITGGVLDAKEKGVPGELKMKPEMVKAVCDKAHAAGYKVAAHVESPEGVKVALENGVDSIEHGAKPDDEMLRLFKEKNAFLCTTISPAVPYALFDRSLTNATEVEQYNGNIVFEGIVECSKAALANDIPVVLGNDVGCPWITQYDFWRELCYFHKYTGVSNAFALYTATKRSAELAGIGDVTGSIEVGKCADMIVTKENPLDNLAALRNVDMVIARGRVIDKPKVRINKLVEQELDRFL
ncbi:imidazolonepropionase and related amidohydrolases [Firmicutes bacterium CAG:882]|nr:imidazolonepropionase and related amidohydrolases [Firmicutes bacterium CAG:882]